MTISSEDYAMMQARLNRHFARAPDVVAADDAVEKEAGLQEQICQFLRERGWFFLWSPMCAPTSLPKGAPDFTIFAPNGITLCAECKARGKKLTVDQAAVMAMLVRQNHHYRVVSSYREFIEFVNEAGRWPELRK